jgi:uncharacterized protein involved in tolerance to divalent cations
VPVACVNVLSLFSWRGKRCQAEETGVLSNTETALSARMAIWPELSA